MIRVTSSSRASVIIFAIDGEDFEEIIIFGKINFQCVYNLIPPADKLVGFFNALPLIENPTIINFCASTS